MNETASSREGWAKGVAQVHFKLVGMLAELPSSGENRGGLSYVLTWLLYIYIYI